MDNFDPYNALLAIATNIPVLLMTAFVLQGHIFLTEDSYFTQKQVKNTLMINLFLTNTQLLLYKMLTDGLEWCGLLVGYCDVFISCLDSHSDGTHSLQRIHCWDSDAMLFDEFVGKLFIPFVNQKHP